MRRKMMLGMMTAAMAVSMNMTALAGQWLSNETGWWWQEDNGSYPANTWKWLDGNKDGTAECYYFDGSGYLMANRETPDGYSVNADGAWIEGGIVQTQAVSVPASGNQESVQDVGSVPDVSGTYHGLYGGQQIGAVIEKQGDTFWIEIDLFLKDEMPEYKGDGLFENEWYSYQFKGNTFIFTEKQTGQLIVFG